MDQPHPSQNDEVIELALFPLNVVLFPGMRLPLHIFEERYKEMIGACVDREVPFGIILIKEGQEVGDPAEPFQVGTTARISQVERLEEGRLNILTQGERRFELLEVIRQLPYLVARVQYLEEEPGEGSSSAVEEARGEYSTFMRHLTSLAGGWTSSVEVPQDPVQLSFAVAASLSSSVELPRDVRQQLLEAPTARERLEKVLPLLKRGNEVLQEQVSKANPFRGPRLN